MLKGIFPFFQQVEPKPHLVISRGLEGCVVGLAEDSKEGGRGRVYSAVGSKSEGNQGGKVSQRTEK